MDTPTAICAWDTAGKRHTANKNKKFRGLRNARICSPSVGFPDPKCSMNLVPGGSPRTRGPNSISRALIWPNPAGRLVGTQDPQLPSNSTRVAGKCLSASFRKCPEGQQNLGTGLAVNG